MIIPDNEIFYKLYLYLEGFNSYIILAEKLNKFLNYIKNINYDDNIIYLFEIVNIIKKAKSSIHKEALPKRGVFYNDKEFNQDYDINKEEAKAIINELRIFCKRRYEIKKKILVDNEDNGIEEKIDIDNLLDHFFPKFDNINPKTNEKEIFSKYLFKFTFKGYFYNHFFRSLIEIYKSMSLVSNQKQIDCIFDLHSSIKYFKNLIIYGQPYSSKSTIIRIYLEYVSLTLAKENKQLKVKKYN